MGEITLAISKNSLIARFEPPVSKRTDPFKLILPDYPYSEIARNEEGDVLAVRYESRCAKDDQLVGSELEEKFRADHETVREYLGYVLSDELVQLKSPVHSK